MTGGKRLALAGGAMLAIAACGTERSDLKIRALSTPLASGQQPASFRVEEGRGYFALNNIGLALEAFRKAMRDDPNSVDALNGMAACYDRIGQFDLSRRYYETALAIDPADPRLYANLAVSLDMQGKKVEAMSVRAEMAQRLAAAASPAPVMQQMAASSATQVPAPAQSLVAPSAPAVATTVVAQTSLAPPAVGRSVTVALAAPKPIASITPPSPVTPVTPMAEAKVAPLMVEAKVAPPVAAKGIGSVTVALASPRPVAVAAGARLERSSSGQVALITTGRAAINAPVSLASSASRRIAPAPIILLNAARHQGLAARTRVYLAQKGWRRIEIGDAPQVATRSVILYPAARRQQATRLAAQFGFALRHGPSSTDRLTILLGRDAAAKRWIKAASA